MHVLRVFVGRMPPAVGNPVADRFGDVVYHIARKSRRNAISNMRHVLGPDVEKKKLKKTVRGVFRINQGRITSFDRSDGLGGDECNGRAAYRDRMVCLLDVPKLLNRADLIVNEEI